MDGSIVQSVIAAVGPAGVLVLAALWLLTRRREAKNGRGRGCPSACPPSVLVRLDAVREDLAEIKVDLRELRASLVRHLEDHATV